MKHTPGRLSILKRKINKEELLALRLLKSRDLLSYLRRLRKARKLREEYSSLCEQEKKSEDRKEFSFALLDN